MLHGSARHARRRAAIQRSKASIKELAGLRPQDGYEVEEARLYPGCPDGAEGTALDGAQRCCVSQGYPIAARRLSLRSPGNRPASDTVCIAWATTSAGCLQSEA